MSWLDENKFTITQQIIMNVLKAGPIPKHIAIIMDGNRRFARNKNVHLLDGHSKGFSKLTALLNWCLYLGVEELTVYAFSIENFKRNKSEVETLMNLANNKFKKILEEKDSFQKHDICVRILGKLGLLTKDLQNVMEIGMRLTQNNKSFVLNIAFAYTARDEIATSIKTIMQGIENKELVQCDLDEELITKCLFTEKSPDPDLLIRTSGEVRLSDFMLWQTTCTHFYFTHTLWPEFDTWDFVKAIFTYQHQYYNLNSIKRAQILSQNKDSKEKEERVECFLKKFNFKRFFEGDIKKL